jgi:hypothetical protein
VCHNLKTRQQSREGPADCRAIRDSGCSPRCRRRRPGGPRTVDCKNSLSAWRNERIGGPPRAGTSAALGLPA